MPTIFAVFLFLLGTVETVASLKYVRKQKKSGAKPGLAMAIGIVCCLLAVLSACYLAATLLLLGGID